MKLQIITIALDAMPWITHHLPMLNRLQGIDWHWHVVEGVALPVADTKWVQPMTPRLSEDGTHKFLQAIKGGRVTHTFCQAWAGKAAMFNHILGGLRLAGEPCIVMQIDADELWLAHQIELIMDVMRHTSATRMDFRCRYFVGKDIVVTSPEGYGNHRGYEWRRVWRWAPGMVFETHEPPKMQGDERKVIDQEQTAAMGLVFDHAAYASRAQVAFKESYYGYKGAVAQWDKLQTIGGDPVRLGDYLTWVKDETTVQRLGII